MKEPKLNMKNEKIIEIYVELFDEGTTTYKKTTARSLDNELYEILPTDNYDPEDEVWKFPPYSIVRLENIIFSDGTKAMLARHQN